jgi:hypothetical protein
MGRLFLVLSCSEKEYEDLFLTIGSMYANDSWHETCFSPSKGLIFGSEGLFF